jgi:hypothetical protein
MNLSVRYPINYSNHVGIPLISSTSVAVNDTNTIITIPRDAFRWMPNTGLIVFRLNTAVPTSGETLPILFKSGNFTQEVTLVGGTPATGASMATTGIYLMWYNKNQTQLQLLTVAS